MEVRTPLPPVVLLLALILLAAAHVLPPRVQFVPFPVNLAGLLPLIVGVYLNPAADGLLKRHGTTVKPFQESMALVTTGVYRRTRHPMYLGFTLILLGLAFLLGSAWPFVIVAFFPVLMEVMYVRVEERMLRDRFGPEWAAYCTRVRRWI